jgi:hypothetical protein
VSAALGLGLRETEAAVEAEPEALEQLVRVGVEEVDAGAEGAAVRVGESDTREEGVDRALEGVRVGCRVRETVAERDRESAEVGETLRLCSPLTVGLAEAHSVALREALGLALALALMHPARLVRPVTAEPPVPAGQGVQAAAEAPA